MRITGKLSMENLRRYKKLHWGYPTASFFAYNFVIVLALALVLHRKDWWGWFGQGVLLKVDLFFVDFLIPLKALLLLAMLFSITTYGERKVIFSKQKVFYHMEYFYRLWRFICRWLIPLTILTGWLLLLL